MLTDNRYFYHETDGKPPPGTEIIFQHTIGQTEVECLNGLELKPQRGVTFRFKKEKNNYYYVTKRAAEKLKEQYKWAWRLFILSS